MRPSDALPLRALCGWLLAAGLVGGVQVAHAANADAWHFMAKATGKRTDIGFGSDGTPLLGSRAPSGVPNVGKMGVTHTPTGTYLDSLGKARAPGGAEVPLAVRKKIPNDVMSRALFRGTMRGLAGGALGLGWALYDVWSELGYTIDGNGNISEPGPYDPVTNVGAGAGSLGSCPGGNYATLTSNGTRPTPYYCTTPSTGWAAQSCGNGNICGWVSTATKDSLVAAGWTWADNRGGAHIVKRSIASISPSAPPLSAVSEQQFVDAMASRSGWPTKASQAFADAMQYPDINLEAADSLSQNPWADVMPKIGTNWDTGTTAPQTVGEPKVSQKTSTNSNGDPIVEQRTEETTARIEGNQVIYNTTTITNIYNETTDTTETITEESDPEDEQKCKDGDQTVGCAEADVPDGEIPKRTAELTYDDTNIFGLGSCPADVMVTIGGQQHAALDFTNDVCPMVVTYVRPLVLTLATLMALFILMPGGKPE